MVAHILSDYKICYTRNLNNHIGVPLTLLSLKQNEEFVIVEIGSNNLGDRTTSKIVKPDTVAVTNIGYAHIEGFKNLQNIQRENIVYLNVLRSMGTHN